MTKAARQPRDEDRGSLATKTARQASDEGCDSPVTQTPRRELGGTHAVGVSFIIDQDCTARYSLIAISENNGDF